MGINMQDTCRIEGREVNCVASAFERCGNWAMSSARTGGVDYNITKNKKGKWVSDRKPAESSHMCFLCRAICKIFGYMMKGIALLLSPDLRARYRMMNAWEQSKMLKNEGNEEEARKMREEAGKQMDKIFAVSHGPKGTPDGGHHHGHGGGDAVAAACCLGACFGACCGASCLAASSEDQRR